MPGETMTTHQNRTLAQTRRELQTTFNSRDTIAKEESHAKWQHHHVQEAISEYEKGAAKTKKDPLKKIKQKMKHRSIRRDDL